ncbi:trace amine-associated receptor 13c-like [Parambassis ranga]|uniref:Trace amine-associated receptor 13c-like n=1 Tax=Parambassis ranga TaxID=210632 RepID=A0A6P7IHE3_9TELE|nr:trace amine-associated receptor 13c-like [Parambassis ranga]
MLEVLEEDYLCFPSLNATCRSMPVTPKELLVEALLYCIAVLTVMLNLLVVISISHFRQLHTPTNLLILSLAVSDLLVGLFVMPAAIIALHSCWFLGKLMCALSYLLTFTLTSASVGNMVLISVDRYVAICHPLRYSTMITSNRVMVCLCLCWLCSLLYNCLIMKDQLEQTHIADSCYHKCTAVISLISGAVDMIVTFLFPVTVIVVLYLQVFVVAVSQGRVQRSQVTAVKSKTVIKRSDMRAARTLGVVILMFILCLCPYYGLALTLQDTPADRLSAQIWLFYCNSSFNPLIYAFFYPWFRKAVKHIISLQILQQGSCDTRLM